MSNYNRFDIDKKKRTYEQWFLLTSDWHFDNTKCNRELLFKHLDEAKKRDAKIIVNGDLLCLMQGKYDKRSSKGAIRQEHNTDSYLTAVIYDTADKLAPYAENIIQINSGNHETAVSQRAEVNITQMLVDRLNQISGQNIAVGEYMGYILCTFTGHKSHHKKLVIAYDHGHWGGVITKGTLSVVRHSSIFPQADVVMSGHTHDGWIVPHQQFSLNANKKKVEIRKQWHIKTGTYKEEFESGKGWAVEKLAMPKYLGSCWMKVSYFYEKDLELEFTLTP